VTRTIQGDSVGPASTGADSPVDPSRTGSSSRRSARECDSIGIAGRLSVARGRLTGMCGRYASVASRSDLLDRFAVDEKDADELRGQDFNVTPT
jgi:hypothetical protein